LRVLIVLLIVKILEFSRFNMNNFSVKRSFYDSLSLSLLFAFIIYVILSGNKKIAIYIEKIETVLARLGSKYVVLLDILVVIFLIFYTLKISNILYTYPIRCTMADMLPIIRGAGESFLSLDSPFIGTFCAWNNYFTYFPMMMIYYLPGILLKFDIRFLSYLYFLFVLIIIYYYHRKKGFYLTGFLIFFILLSSKLFHFFLISVHTFPFLFMLSLILFFLLEKNDSMSFFSYALALATRKVFWLFSPLFLIYFIKHRKINLQNGKFFILGLLMGFSPAFLYPKSFVMNKIVHFPVFVSHLKDNLFLNHSLGLSYYLSDSKEISTIIQFSLLILIYIFAIKYLNIKNLWLFLSIASIVSIYFASYVRPEEYYFLPLIIILCLSPLKSLKNKIRKTKISIPALFVFTCVFLIMLSFPLISGRNQIINIIRGGTSDSQSRHISSKGYLEFSIGRNFVFKKDKKLILLLRRKDYKVNEPVQVKLNINEKKYMNKIFSDRRIRIIIDPHQLNKYFFSGSNYLEISLEKPENFFLRIFWGN